MMNPVIKKKKNIWRWGLYLLLSPFVLFFILATLVYLPPVQRFVIDRVTENLEEAIGVDVHIEKVRLAFPLDLAIHGVLAKEENLILADVQSVRLSVPFRPLFKGRIDIEGFEAHEVSFNTGNWIADASVRGEVGKLSATTRGIDLKKEILLLNEAEMSQARLFVALSDTAKLQTEEDSTYWKIQLPRIKLKNSRLMLSLPGDSMRMDFGAELMLLSGGNLDLGAGEYQVSALNLRGGDLLYAARSAWNDGLLGNQAYQDNDSAVWYGHLPQGDGIDPGYVQVERLNFALKDMNYSASGDLSAKLGALFLTERSGLRINNLLGELRMKGDSLSLNHWALHTPTSHVDMDLQLQLDSLMSNAIPFHKLDVEGEIGSSDIVILAKGAVRPDMLSHLPDSPLDLELHTKGNKQGLSVDTLCLSWDNVLRGIAKGEIIHPLTDRQLGKIDFNLQTYDKDFFQSCLATLDMSDFCLPRMNLKGNLQCNGNNYKWNIANTVSKGDLSFVGHLNVASEQYHAELETHRFPLQAFMPNMGMSDLTTSLTVWGKGLDPLKTSSSVDMKMSLDSLTYDSWQLGKLGLISHLSEGLGQINFEAANDIFNGEGILDVDIRKDIKLKLRSDIPEVYLARLMELSQPLTLGTSLSIDMESSQDFSTLNLTTKMQNVRFITEEKGIPVRDIQFNFNTSVDTTSLRLLSGDLRMVCSAEGGVPVLAENFANFVDEAMLQISTKKLNQKNLRAVAPGFDFHLNAGQSNFLFNVCRELGYGYQSVALNLGMTSELGANGVCDISAFTSGDLVLDTISLQLRQDSTGLVADGWIKNFKKRNKTKFESKVKAYLLDTGAGAEVKILNRDGVVGMDFGVLAALEDKGVNIHLYPEHPVIAFRNFTVNKDNYFLLGNDSLIRSDIDLLADDGTGLRIYSQPSDSVNDLTVSLNRLNLESISNVFPYFPSMGGMLSSDFHIIDDGKEFSAMATMNAENLALEGAALGNVDVEAIYLPKTGGEHHVNVFTSVEGNEVLTLAGIYRSNEKNQGFEGKIDMIDFPLELINGFLAGTDIAMKGKAAGNLSINGVLDQPKLDGEVLFSEAHIYSDVYGLDFRMDDKPVKIKDNKLVLTDYGLYSMQEANPLRLDGVLDMSVLSDIQMDFQMVANNFELINAKKQTESLVFGKVYADFYGEMKGSMDNLSVKGKLSILDRTDMTYVLKDSPLTVDDRLHDLVQFVDFEEEDVAEEEVVVPMGVFNMTLAIQISDAALFHCNLSEDGSNYVDLEGGGDLTLRLTPQGDMRLTGRFTANSGEMNYSLPIIPLKTFKLVQGSYVEFTGDVLNPTLNIAAKERMKAMVTENDQPRSVAFDVGVSITQPLNRMGLEFTIEAPEDLTIQNQLATLTRAERGKVAVGMLATGLYLNNESMSSAGTGFKASNALTAFLQSEIQNIAGSALKTIDVTIGMENNLSSTGSTTTDYSFQFAKRFWGNRIAVIIGGKVSTGADAENSAESFIDNIAFEYRLDKTASRYVRVFYERSFQDPLEGQLTKTGAGLVLRRKSDKLGDLFIFRNNRSGKKKSAKKEK